MNRWFAGIILVAACVAGGTTTLVAHAQPVMTPSPMVSASPTPVSTMQP